MRFTCPKILNTRAILGNWYFNGLEFYKKRTSLKMGNDPLFAMILIGTIAYFLLFSPTFTFELKASALTWGYVFHRAQTVWKWSPVRHCTKRMFRKMLAKVCYVFLKQPMRIWAPLRIKRVVRLSARNFCVKFYTCFCSLFFVTSTFVICLLLTETLLKSEQIQK